MIENQAKRKKIFYVPGMISLIFIPLFCLLYFYKVEAFKSSSFLEFSVPNKEDFKKYNIENLRKYREFNFEDQSSQEQQKLKELRFFVRDLVTKYDTINGAKIHFGAKTDYDTFVQVVNIMFEEKMPAWGFFTDDIYALGNAKPKLRKIGMSCGTNAYSRENALLEEEEKRKNNLNNFQFSFLKQQWILLVGYLGIVLLNIFTLVKFNKNK